jgi:hypothetical protein
MNFFVIMVKSSTCDKNSYCQCGQLPLVVLRAPTCSNTNWHKTSPFPQPSSFNIPSPNFVAGPIQIVLHHPQNLWIQFSSCLLPLRLNVLVINHILSHLPMTALCYGIFVK